MQPLPTQKPPHMAVPPPSSLIFSFFSHFRFLCFEDHGMGTDLTSTKAPLSPSLLLFHWWCILLLLYFLPPCFTVFLSLPPFFPSISLVLQVSRQLHGGRQGRLHEGESSQRHADHHPAQEVHGAHQDHLPTGQETQTGFASSDGGRRRPGQPISGSGSGRSSVPRVRLTSFIKTSLVLFRTCIFFPRLFGDLTSLSLRFLHRHPQNHLCWYLNVWMCVRACRGVKKTKTCCLSCSLSVNRFSVCSPSNVTSSCGLPSAQWRQHHWQMWSVLKLQRYKYLLHWTL